MARTTDPELIAQIADADAGAFEELYRRHADQAFMLARKLCASRELAEEVTQESFIALWRSADRYRPALGSVKVWLASIVRNRAIDAWRRAAVRPIETPVIEDGPGQLQTAIGSDFPAAERAMVLSLIAELPVPQKEAVFLAYFGGMTHDEIAAWSHAPLGTVKGRIRMGLHKLRDALEAAEQTPVCESGRTRGGGVPGAELDAGRRRHEARVRHRRPALPAPQRAAG